MSRTIQMSEIAKEEIARVRFRNLGFVPKPKQIKRAISRYLWRHVIYERLYKLKLINC